MNLSVVMVLNHPRK